MFARAILVVGMAFGGSVGDLVVDTGQIQHLVRDSAGIRIVDNRRPEIDSWLDWVIGAESDVRIGTRDGSGAFQLYRARDATRLADGRIVVANGGSDELLLFSAHGDYLGTRGGRCEGPLESSSRSPSFTRGVPISRNGCGFGERSDLRFRAGQNARQNEFVAWRALEAHSDAHSHGGPGIRRRCFGAGRSRRCAPGRRAAIIRMAMSHSPVRQTWPGQLAGKPPTVWNSATAEPKCERSKECLK